MKVFIIGHLGWIGGKYIKLFNEQKIDFIYSENRTENKIELCKDIIKSKATHVLCCIGRTHGTFNGKYYPTIDYLEHKETLKQNINDNLYAPLSLALFCQSKNLHFTYIGTGCIFNNKDMVYTENDNPDFFGSNYSIVKGFTDMLMHQTNSLNLRIRMPITSENNPRNFITKILNYEKICSIPNSMTVLDELLPISILMMKNNDMGTYNFTNPGIISHNEILQMYNEIVDNSFEWKNFTIDEQDKILLGKRSNNRLDTIKLEQNYKISNIHDSVRNCLLNWKT